MGITEKKTGKTTYVNYDGFQLFPSEGKGKLTAARSLNCCCADGVLQGGIGYEFFYTREGDIPRTAFADTARSYFILEGWSDGEGSDLTPYYFIVTDDGNVYQYSAAQTGYVKKAELGMNVSMVMAAAPNGDMKAVAVGEKGAYCIDGETWTAMEDVDQAAAVCFAKNRIFLGEKPSRLLYGNPEKPWDFSISYNESGYVYLPLNKGTMVDMVEYGEFVYIFFQRGILRLKPDGLARNFQVTEIPYSGGEIFAKSVGVCGNWIFFLSEHGICRFDGKEVEKVGRFFGILPKKEGQECSHATVGEYYVLKYYDEGAWEKKTVALRADGKDGYFMSNYMGMNESNRLPLCSIGVKYATLKLGGDLPDGEERVFESEYVDLGSPGKKYLKTVTLYGEGGFTFEVFDGKEWTAWELEDIPMKTTLKIGLRAEDFRFRFVLDKESKVRCMTLEFERLE